MAWGERSERAKRASEALWCFLWVSMAHCACTALLLSGAFLCLLLLLWVLLLLLVLLPLVGNFGPLQLHASTTFKNVRASRSLLRQVFLGFWKDFGGQNWCQNQFLMCFLRCLFGGDLGVDFFIFFNFCFSSSNLDFCAHRRGFARIFRKSTFLKTISKRLDLG